MPTPATPFAIMTTPPAGAGRASAPRPADGAADAPGFAAVLGEQASAESRAPSGAPDKAATGARAPQGEAPRVQRADADGASSPNPAAEPADGAAEKAGAKGEPPAQRADVEAPQDLADGAAQDPAVKTAPAPKDEASRVQRPDAGRANPQSPESQSAESPRPEFQSPQGERADLEAPQGRTADAAQGSAVKPAAQDEASTDQQADAESAPSQSVEAEPAEGQARQVFPAGAVQAPIEPQPRPLDTPVTLTPNGAPAEAPIHAEAPAAAMSGDEAARDIAAQWRTAQEAGETRALRDALRTGEAANADTADPGVEPQAPASDPKAGVKAGADAKADGPSVLDKGVTPATAPAKPSPEPIQRPEAAAQAADAAADADLQGEVALRDARVISERAPGDVLRAAIKSEAGQSHTGSPRSEAAPARAASDIKPAAATTPSTPAAAASPAQSPAALFATPAGFDLMPSPFTAPIIGDIGSAEPSLDPALMKLDGGMDPAAPRLDAKAEIRTASTLQFAQGPRFTPHSAQNLAAQIAQRFSDGARVFDIRLDPPELGRVEVRLELGSDNSVRALLAAERTETLAELQRSARDLERALADAGLELGENGLSFSLTDDGASAEDSEADGFDGAAPVFAGSDAIDAGDALTAPIRSYGFLLARAERLDVSV